MHNTGAQTRCFTYIDDAIAACIKLSKETNANGEVFNIGSDVEYSVKEVLESIVSVSGKDLKIETVNTQDSFGDAFEDIMRRVPKVSKIYNTIGWKATTSLHDGLSKTYNWITKSKA